MAKKKAKPDITTANEALKSKRAYLDSVPVELQVRDIDHAMSEEVVNFSISHLKAGGTWAELRRKLGLGPAHIDRTWRRLRHALVESVLPSNEEEALKDRYSTSALLVHRLEGFMDELEEKIEGLTDDKNQHHYYKLKLEGIKTLLEKNEKNFEHYLEMKKLKVVEKGRQGVSIIFQNNYHIPRPGDNQKDVTPETKEIKGE